MSLTQADLAKHLGLSRISVARALNGHAAVSEATRQRVLEAARELGYNEHSNQHARALIAKRYGRRIQHNAIAVLIPREPFAARHGAFFTQLLDGIEAQANQYRETHNISIDLFLFSMFEPRIPRLFTEGGIDGAINLVALSPELAAGYAKRNIPVVSLVSPISGAFCLGVDNAEGMRLAVKHLAKLGHERIAYVGAVPTYSVGRDRLAGYKKGLEECGLPYNPELVETSLTMLHYASEAVEQLLARTRKFTALVCYNDLIAMRAVPILMQHGFAVPEDVSIVGFDDISVEEEFPLPLTSVYFDRMAMGKRAVQWIYQRPEERREMTTSGDPHSEVFPVTLAVRESTAPPRKKKSALHRRPKNKVIQSSFVKINNRFHSNGNSHLKECLA